MHFTLAPARVALGNRRFASYLAVSCLADCGFWIAIVAQGWLVVRLTHSPVWLGIVAAAAQSPALFMSLLGGVIADRFDRRKAILATECAVGIIAIATAWFVARDAISLVGLAVLAFASGTMLAIEHPIDRAFLYSLIDGDDVEQSVALSSVEFSIARTAGPALGGIAIATIGIAGGYALEAAFVVPIVAFAIYAVRVKIGRADATDSDNRDAAEDASLGEAWQYLREERSILTICALVALFTIGLSPYVSLLADIAKNTLHVREGGYGALQAAAGLGALAGALGLSLSSRTHGKRTVIVSAVFVGAVLLGLFTVVRQPWLAGATLFAMGAVDSLVYALGNTYIQERTDERHRGRVNAIFTIAFLGGIPVGNLALGFVASSVGSEWALFGSSLVVALGAVVFFFVAPRVSKA